MERIFTHRRLFVSRLLFVGGLFIFASTGYAQPPASKILASPKSKPSPATKEVAAKKMPLSLDNVSRALRSDKATAAQKNQILIQAIRERGISFELTSEIEAELTEQGAGKPLIELIRKEAAKLTESAFFHRERGDNFRNRRSYDQAIASYNRAIELDPADRAAYNNRGLTYEALKKYDEAAADFTKVVELDPSDRNGFHNRGVIYYHRDEFEKAIADFTRAIDIDPNFTEAYIHRANAYQVMGRKDLAEADRQKARNLRQ